LLAAAGFEFEVRPAEVDERTRDGECAAEYVVRLAVAKARTVEAPPEAVVLGADTAVVVDGLILGKPVDEADAVRMLHLLSAREHEVLTGVALRHGMDEVSAVDTSRVRFLPLSSREISWYVASGEPADKAGAYAVQGLASRFVDRIVGSYSNVVGLPVARVWQMMRQMGFKGGGESAGD
jgi:septum formation protein